MKRLSRSITVDVALSLIVLVGLTGSAVAAQPAQTFTVGSVAYTAATLTEPARLEAFDLEWAGYRPDSACISAWNIDASSPFFNTCSAIKGSEQKYPQNLEVTGLIDSSLLTTGTSYNLRVDLIRHAKTIAYSAFYPITAGTNYP